MEEGGSSEAATIDMAKIKSEIKEIIVKTLISIQPDLVHHYRTS